MKSLGLSHYALAMGAASALLAGCGGSQQIGQTASSNCKGRGHGSHDTMRRPWTSFLRRRRARFGGRRLQVVPNPPTHDKPGPDVAQNLDPYPFADSGSTFGFWRDLRLDFGGVVRSAPSLDSTSGVSGRISN